MLSSAKGSDVSDSGIALPVKVYQKGEEYYLGKSLVKAFCDDSKSGVRCDSKQEKDSASSEKKGSKKSQSGAPENKSSKGFNKRK